MLKTPNKSDVKFTTLAVVLTVAFGSMPWLVGLLFVGFGAIVLKMIGLDWPSWTGWIAFAVGFTVGIWLDLKMGDMAHERQDREYIK